MASDKKIPAAAPLEIRRAYEVYDNTQSAVDCSKDPGHTRQSEKESCDINNIVAAAVRGEFVQNLKSSMPQFLDLTGLPNYQEALDLVIKAQETFMELPAKIRTRFDNNPGKFVDFMSTPGNETEARLLGLLEPLSEVEKSSATTPAEPLLQAKPAQVVGA